MSPTPKKSGSPKTTTTSTTNETETTSEPEVNVAGPDAAVDMASNLNSVYSMLKGTWNGTMHGFTFHGVPEVEVNRDGVFGRFGIDIGGRTYSLTLEDKSKK